MRGWREYSIKDLIENKKITIGDGYRAKNSELSTEGIPFARAGNINNGFHFIGADCFPLKNLKKVGNKISQPSDIVFTSKGTVGRFAYVKEGTQPFVYSPQLCFWRSLDQSVINTQWLYFWMNGREFWEQAHSVKGQTDMADYVNLNDQRNMKITIPPLPEQRAIASILSSLDDKIDLLHRQNKTLEAMAETLFRQWFVEPCQTGVPAGWIECNIDSMATVKSGTTPRTNNPDYWDGGIHWTTPRDITNLNGIFLFDTERKITEIGLKQIGSGLLPSGSLLMSSRAPVGALAFSEIPVAINQGYAGIVCDKGFSREFLYLWLKCNMDCVQSYANGSTFQEISKSSFKSLLVQHAGKKYNDEFQCVIFPLFEKIKNNSIQITTLTKLRDTLLPKLMSGEVRVS